MRIGDYGLPGWAERVRIALLSFFFVALSLPVAVQQAALGALLVFYILALVWQQFTSRTGLPAAAEPPRQESSLVRQPLSTPLDRALLFFFAALLLSTLWSPAVLHSLAAYRKLWLVGAFFAVYHLLKEPHEAQRLVALLVITATVVAAYGVVQHFTGIDLARQVVGKESNIDARWFGGQGGFRTKGLHPSGITYAYNLLFPLTLVSALLVMPGWSWPRRLALGGSWGVMAFALLFSLTRGAWIAYVVVLLGLGIIRGGKALMAVAVCVAVLGVFLLSAGGGVRERAVRAFDPALNIGRSQIWQANLDMVKERPWIGWGYGNYKRFRAPYYQRYAQANVAHAHNNFLQMWVDAGVFGLAAFLALFWTMLRKGWRAYLRLSPPALRALALGGVLSVLAFLLGGLTQYNFGDAEVVIVLWATTGLLMRLYTWAEEEREYVKRKVISE